MIKDPRTIRVKITDKVVEKATPDSSRPFYYIWDTEIIGFCCRIFNSRKTYSFYYRSPVTEKYTAFKIGCHGMYTADTARNKVKVICGEIAKGNDPRIEKIKKETEATQSISFIEFWKVFTKRHIEIAHKPSTIRANKSIEKKYILPFFKKKKLKDITYIDLLKFQKPLCRGAKMKCTTLLRTAFSKAELWGYRPMKTTPFAGMHKEKSRVITNYLTREQLVRLEESLILHKTSTKICHKTIDAIRLLIYTGCRMSEIFGLSWDEVDLENSILKLKEAKMGGRTVPLNDKAKGILLDLEKEERQEYNNYVFPSPKVPKSHIVAAFKSWDKIRKYAGVPNLRIHDIRHSFASFAIEKNINLLQLKNLLGHKSIGSTAKYAHSTVNNLIKASNNIFDDDVKTNNA